MSLSRTPRRNEALMRREGVNLRPAAHSLGIALCAQGVVAIGILAALFAVVLGIWP